MIINPLNFEKLIFKPEILLKVKNKEKFFPLHMTISLTNYCNHKCIWCSVYEYQQGKAIFFKADKLVAFLEKAAVLGLQAVTYIGKGEPALHPDFKDIVTRVNALGIEQGIFTNGTHLDRYADQYLAYFSFIRCSLDAYDEESHLKTHGVKNQFFKIIKNIETLTGKRQNPMPRIGAQFVYHNLNYKGIREITRISKDAGLDYLSFKPAFNLGATDVRGEKNTLQLSDMTEVIGDVRTEFEDDSFKVFFRDFQIQSIEKSIFDYGQCYAGIYSLYLFEDENIYLCAHQKIKAGNINHTPEQIMATIYKTLPGINLKKCPGGCRYHSLNRLMHLLVHPDQRGFMNENFI